MIKEAIQWLVLKKSLTADEAAEVMGELMDGKATPAQIGSFITALNMKGETVEETVGMVRAMRARAIPVKISGMVVDTCGTGGDNLNTFNISTAAAFVAAGAGLTVAKHGNRAMSSHCGSADVLEALGVKIDLGATGVKRCLEEAGIGFMFAPVFHPAMKNVAGVRREIGIRTIFNVLGPLANPAGAKRQVIGVPGKGLGTMMAAVLQQLGTEHSLVVHGLEGLDEISISGESMVWEIKQGNTRTYKVSPEELGIKLSPLSAIKGATATENAGIIRKVLQGKAGAPRDAVLVNAAAALVAGGRVSTLKEGVAVAGQTIDSGEAFAKLEQLVQVSQNINK